MLLMWQRAQGHTIDRVHVKQAALNYNCDWHVLALKQHAQTQHLQRLLLDINRDLWAWQAPAFRGMPAYLDLRLQR